MNHFLWKGVIRDRSRTLLPVLVVTIGVFFIIFLDGFVNGIISNMIGKNAIFQTGHVKVMTKAYNQDKELKPIDLAILDLDLILEELHTLYPVMDWNPRIYFGGLLDVPDEHGETLAQGPVVATAYNLLSPENKEVQRLGLDHAITAGKTIQKQGEVLISYDFAERFNVKPNDMVTFFGSTMYGSMSFTNFTVAGVVRFGITALDRGAIVVDITDARLLLDMENAAGEILGFFPDDRYDRERAESVKTDFNARYLDVDDEYAPYMIQLTDQALMAGTIAFYDRISLILLALLVLALSIVLWNTGVLGGIRRYNEFGIRLAMGEEKRHIYSTLLIESLFIGLIGSSIGTLAGIAVSIYLGKHGIDYGVVVDTTSLLIEPVIRSQLTPRMYYIGFVPGVISMLIGSALAGIAVYKRKTAELFKELG